MSNMENVKFSPHFRLSWGEDFLFIFLTKEEKKKERL